MKRWLKGLVVGMFVAIVGVVLGLSPVGASLEQGVGIAWLFGMRGAIEPPEDVAVVAMDSRTGENLGLPPLPRDWPRSMHGRLVDELVSRGASTIVFDVHFGREKSREDDQLFVDAVRRAGRVVLVELLTGKRQPISDQQGRHVGIVWAEELVPPFPGLAEAAAGLATFPLPKEGASVYQFWLFKESADNAPTLPAVALQLHAREQTQMILDLVRAVAPDEFSRLPSLSQAFSNADELRNFMRALRSSYESAPDTLGAFESTSPAEPRILPEQALEGLYAGEANRFLNFYGPPGTITTVPYHAVILGGDPNVPDEALDFTGKVVFVGYSDMFDPGQMDRFYTVFTRKDGVDLSGVEIAATGFANLLTNRSLSPVEGWAAMAMLIAFGLVIGLVVYAMPAYAGVPVAFVLAAAYGFAAQYAFSESAILVPVATPLLVQAPLALFIGLLGQYLLERRRGQRISDAINYYLPDDIARDLAQDKLDTAKINKVVFSACFATDMAGFSTVAEQMPPGELAEYLNDYFETLAAPLKKYGVHVTEFRADAIMCAWTAEEASPEPRRKAILAALEAGVAVKDFKQRHPMAEARLRIGLEAGWVYVGHAGGGGHFVYSIVGDSANTASRVEGLNKHVGTEILATGDLIEGFENIVTRYLGAFQFVGKTEAMPIYEVIALREKATDEQLALCESFQGAMADYDTGDWQSAAQKLERMLVDFPEDGPSKFLLDRCRRYMTEPESVGEPGVIRMDAK
ncbi:MAG: adenylate/guanylate cyclase domain-containing protein [Sedimenticolaceae bacterium]